MRRKTRFRLAVIRSRKAVKGAALLLAAFSFVRLAASLGDGSSASWLASFVSRSEVTDALLEMGFGPVRESAVTEKAEPIVQEPVAESSAPEISAAPTAPSPIIAAPIASAEPAEIFTGTLSADSMSVKNYTDYDIDLTALLNEPLTLDFSADGPQVLIVHTHGSEAYTPDGDDTYIESDPSRTQDRNYNMIRVGDELESALAASGISVLHDREMHDYPSYTGSYSRSLESVQAYLEEFPTIQLIIDLHRDAIENEDGSYYRTIAHTGDITCAQIMLVAGTDYSGLEHPDWHENLKLALRLQYAMDVLYPSLARPLNISQYRYNQDVAPGALIVEVGTNGNTLQEALAAVRLFADAAAAVIK